MWRVLAGGTAVFSLYAMGCAGPAEPNGEAEPGTNPVEILLNPASEVNLTGEVGLAVSPAPAVLAVYPDGRPASAVKVFFWAERGGTVALSATTTDSRGMASAGEWHLGSAVGSQRMFSSVEGSSRQVVFTATAVPGPVASIEAVSGQGQFGRAGSTLPDPLRVRLTDRFGNRIPGAGVSFRVTAGGGALSSALAETDSVGVAYSGAWQLGPGDGTQEVLAESGDQQAMFTARACDCLTSTLAYVRGGDLFLRSLLGQELRLSSGDAFDAAPAWSPDGLRLAFARMGEGGNYFGSIYTMYAGASVPALLLNGGVGPGTRLGGLGSPAWSPDGSQLAVTRGDCIYDCEILFANEQGVLSAPIATLAAYPAWSKDGSRIAYVGLSGDDGYHTLWVMNANGSGKTELVPSDGSGLFHPTWSPDGRQIAFARCSQGSCQVWLIAADGSGLSQLSNFSHELTATDADWSPDGYWIAITLWESVSRKPWVAIIPATGGGWTSLWEGHSPAWRPEGPQP